MTTVIIIFYISIISALGMIFWRAWELRHSNNFIIHKRRVILPHLPFRHLEKNMLYLTNQVLQNIVFRIAKYWFIITGKIKKWVNKKWPQIDSYFTEKPRSNTSYRHSFLKKAILESKAKIKKIKAEVDKEI